MNSDQWKEIKDIFANAIDLSEQERPAFLESCSQELRSEVEKLLAAHDKAGEFILEPAMVEAGLSENDDQDFYAGKQIDSYKIITEIGHGGMGTVYLANRADESFDKPVAIKLIKRGMDTNAVLKRFVMERQILARLEHPNIAVLLDGGSTADGLPYLVMEYVDGSPITKFCDSHRLATRKRLELFQKVCSAISYAHQNLVVHRDVKPSNILITEDGTPKLLDFGIAKLLNPDWSLDTNEATETMFRIMTPEYASPEQIRGLPITTASDVYSLGVVLYELLCGERPYKIDSRLAEEAKQIILTAEPVKPSSVVRSEIRQPVAADDTADIDAPSTADEMGGSRYVGLNRKSLRGDLDNIILKALRKEPERRYASVHEFSEDIRRHLEGLPVTATADTTIYRAGKFVKRHRTGVLASSAIALILLLATAVTTWQAVIARREQAKAEQRFSDVRRLANSLVFEFHDSIQNLPGSTPARELLISRALEYLDRLAGEAGAEASLQLELAAAYDKIGDIQGGFGTSQLGQRENADGSYRKALAIREALVAADPGNIELRRNLATSYTKRGDILWVAVEAGPALESYEKALEINRKLAVELPDDPGIRSDLAISYRNVGYMHGASNHIDESLQNTRQAVALFETLAAADPNNNKFQYELALSYDTVAVMITGLTDDHAEALVLMRKAHAIGETLLAADPDNTKLRRGQAVGNYNVAMVSAKLGDTKTGFEDGQKALVTFTELMNADPQNNEFIQAVSMVQTFICEMMIKNGEAEEAIRLLKQSLSPLEKTFAASPTDEIAHFRIAVAEAGLGQGYAVLAADEKSPPQKRLAHLRETCSWFQKSKEIFMTFQTAGKLTGEDAERLEVVNSELAKCLKAGIGLDDLSSRK